MKVHAEAANGVISAPRRFEKGIIRGKPRSLHAFHYAAEIVREVGTGICASAPFVPSSACRSPSAAPDCTSVHISAVGVKATRHDRIDGSSANTNRMPM